MQFFASLFVGKPLFILVVAAFFLLGYLGLWFSGSRTFRSTRPLLNASIAWGLYAAWEWLVQIKTPEANIRADLLVIWPFLAILSLWALFRAFR